MNRLQQRIGFVLRMTNAIVIEREASLADVLANRIAMPAVLVNVITEVEHQVELVLGHVLVRGVQARLVVLTRSERHAQLVRALRHPPASCECAQSWFPHRRNESDTNTNDWARGDRPRHAPNAQAAAWQRALPCCTTLCIASSSAISHVTSTLCGSMPPPGTNGCGARRVHRTTPFEVGSPEATPSEKGSFGNFGLCVLPSAELAKQRN